ncbi:VTT domain-containing protein [Candidatus Roizmanbacteria bacterium]|nr:VTT domain-containing protein [Candidatus Roizmanbacteria bacterium]
MEKVIPFMGDIIEYLHRLSEQLPLELFILVGTFLEEIISPIPSPLVTTLAGSLAAGRGTDIWYVLTVIAVLGALSKTAASYLFYIFADKFEDVVVPRFGKFFGVTHKQIEMVGKHMNRNRQQTLLLIGLRALPIIPGLPVSLVAGLIKLNVRSYLIGTFIGYIFRNMLFLYFGYSGVSAYNHILEGLDTGETIMQVLVVFGLGGFIAWAYYRRRKMKM